MKKALRLRSGQVFLRPGFAPILILIGVLAVATLVGGAFWFGKNFSSKPANLVPQSSKSADLASPPSPSPEAITPTDETANWKVLNNKNGFSLKYPDSLKALGEGMEVDETNAYDVIIATNPGNPQGSSPSLHINISTKSGTVYKDMTLAQISKENYDANQANKNTFKQVVTPLKLITLDGKPAYTYTLLTSGFSGKWIGWLVSASAANVEKLTVIESESLGNYFIIVYSAEDPTITKVISTFKFTQ